jgi:hypothetical protein
MRIRVNNDHSHVEGKFEQRLLVRKSKSYFKKAGQSFILENISHFMKASYYSYVRQMDQSFLEGKYQYSSMVVKDVSSKVQFVEGRCKVQ